MKTKLANMLLAGNSRFNTDLVAAYVDTNKKIFGELIDLMHHAEPPIPQRAAWVMTAVTDIHPWLIQPYIKDILERLPLYNHPGLVRSVLRQFSQMEFPEEITGELYDLCYNFLNDTKQPVAIRVHAMQILFNISEKEPDLKNELKLIFNGILVGASGGLANRACKLLNKLNKR